MNLGNAIKRIRKEKGIGQLELSVLTGISQTYLSQIESNSKEPKINVLREICVALDIPIPFLFLYSLEAEDVQESKKEMFLTISKITQDLFVGG